MKGLLEKLGNLTTQSVLIAAILLTGVYYLAFFNDGAELDTLRAKLQTELTEQQKTEAEADRALAEIEQVRASFGALSEQFRLVSAQLPTNIEQTEILSLVDRLSKESGLSIKSKEWRELRKEGTVLEALPMRIAAEGSFPEIYAFVSKLADVERVITLGNVTITASRNSRQTTRSQLDLELKVYRFTGKHDQGARK